MPANPIKTTLPEQQTWGYVLENSKKYGKSTKSCSLVKGLKYQNKGDSHRSEIMKRPLMFL